MLADFLKIEIGSSEVFNGVPHTDQIELLVPQIRLEKVPLNHVEAQFVYAVSNAVLCYVDSSNDFKVFPRKFKKEAISAADFKQAFVPGRVCKLTQHVQPEFEVPAQNFAILLVVAVLFAEEVVFLVDPKKFLLLNVFLRENELARLAAHNRGIQRRIVLRATDDTRSTHES